VAPSVALATVDEPTADVEEEEAIREVATPTAAPLAETIKVGLVKVALTLGRAD
jgi:hypothetical protein